MGFIPDITKKIYKLFEKEIEDWVLSERYCYKHMKQCIEKRISQKNYSKYRVKSDLGFCSGCRAIGIVYYLVYNKHGHF